MESRSSLAPWGLILIGLGVALARPGGSGTLSGAAAGLVVQYVQAADRGAQARAVAALYADAAAKVGSGVYTSALEAHQHVLDGAQRKLVPQAAGWSAAIKAIDAEVTRRLGVNPPLAELRKAFTDVRAGLESVQ